ncbi:MAG: endonuclease III [Methanosarcinales archaeon]
MNLDKIIHRLQKQYPINNYERNDPFKVLITTVLSQRTRSLNTYKASKKLFAKYNTPELLAQADVHEIEQLIKESGYYKTKASRIKEISRILVESFDSKVPENIDELLSLPGVGRKTANCVLIYAFNKDAIAVDTHVHRISNRLMLVSTKTPEQTEKQLQKIVPKKYWKSINMLLIKFGQNVCKPIKPLCSNCILHDVCLHVKNINSKEFV